MNFEVERLLDLATKLPPGRRAEFLAQQCPDGEIRAEVESLLEFANGVETYFEDAIRSVAVSLRRSRELAAGDAIGPYRIVALIGRGGMGSVYLAERADGEIQQKVAVKLLRADGHRLVWRDRFLKERQLLASLHHPSIVHVIDAGHTEDGLPFLVMEHVEGVPIDQYAAGIGVRERLKLFVRVCEGVSHAHRHLIIHRDLKPSNILVDASGQPKLLDFGIAKLLDETGDATQTVERLLTPQYASPEQLRGGAQTTATDVYSLGAVLYKLLVGAAPNGSAAGAPVDVIPPSRMNPEIPKDVDFIVRKALRPEPEDRYLSTDDFANDVRAALEWRPVAARSGDIWYRTRRYLRRYPVPLAAAMLAIASLAAGLYAADRERMIAAHRFAEVRQLANKLFDIEIETRKLAGNTRARQLIVDTALEYLRRLAADVHDDPGLALEVGHAYLRVARVQGVPTTSNLGQMDQAEESLCIAEGFVRSVLASQPANRTAILRSAQIAHDRMLLARYGARYDEALALARKSAEWLEKLNGNIDADDVSATLSAYLNVADQHARGEQLDEALRICRRGMDLARSLGRRDYLPNFLWVSSDVLRRRGELEEALKELDESVRLLQPGTGEVSLRQTMNLSLALICQGELLGATEAISLGRRDPALRSLEQAFELADRVVHQDPYDQMSRSRVANAGLAIGDILRSSAPGRALALFDHTLHHVAEVPNNSSFRRFEASALIGSSYALRQLGRRAEAGQRLDTAFQLLKQVHLYPADSIATGSEAVAALRALAAYEAGKDNLPRAMEIHQELLTHVHAAAERETNLTDAVRISTIYREAAALKRRAGRIGDASILEERDRALWRGWDHRLPNNTFIRRQLGASISGESPPSGS